MENEASRVLALIEGCAVPMAVCDYGEEYAKRMGCARFVARDLPSVKAYGLKVVAYNPAAQRKDAFFGHLYDRP